MLLRFGHGCSDNRMHSEHERYFCLGMDALVLGSEHERYHGLGMDALVIVCSGNTNVILVWAWMLSWSDAGTRTILWFEYGCSGYWLHSEDEDYGGFGMDALVSVCTRKTEKRDACYTQYFGPSKHFECVVPARQATSGEVGAFMLRRSQ